MNTPIKNREKVVKRAIANEKLEGLNVSRETKKIADNYVTGKASAKSVAAKIRARYGAL
ncbi:MAG TPA: antitoxin VbhA family protein [Candidatus Saccharimonadales bacterium]|nr:antitoxin VbhA family protein [Candidatus Saccharimonadales bacterium]